MSEYFETTYGGSHTVNYHCPFCKTVYQIDDAMVECESHGEYLLIQMRPRAVVACCTVVDGEVVKRSRDFEDWSGEIGVKHALADQPSTRRSDGSGGPDTTNA